MSEIKTKSQNWSVRDKNDVIALYEGVTNNPNIPGHDPKIGMELELNFYKAETLETLTAEESKCFVCEGKTHGIGINKEPSASTLEIITDPYERRDFHLLIEQMNRRFSHLWDLSLEHDMLPSPFGYLPQAKPEDHHWTKNQRYLAFWVPPRADVVEAAHSFLDPSIQVSVSYKNWDHLLRIIRLSVALEPFFILTTEADAGFYEGQKITGSPRTRILSRRGRNGGIPDFYFTAKSGEELIDRHIDHTLNNPHMFVCFDHGGKLDKIPDLYWARFSELEEKGLGPQNLLNYRQAQSMSWRRAVNISEIRDSGGTLFGHRAEIASLFCSGLQHQRATAAVMSYLLAYCNNFYANIRDTLLDFGIDLENLDSCRDLLEANFQAVHTRRDSYFETVFGTKTIKDFAQSFAEIIQECLQPTVLQQYSSPLLYILEEGRPDWLVYKELFQTLEQQQSYMRALPNLVHQEPSLIAANECADFTKNLIRSCLGKQS